MDKSRWSCAHPGCNRKIWNRASVCHVHAGAHQQWMNSIMSSGRTTVLDQAPKPRSHKKKRPSTATSAGAGARLLPPASYLFQAQSPPSGLVLPSASHYLVPPETVPHLGQAAPIAGQSFLPCAFMQAAAPFQESYIPGHSVNMAMLPPHMATPYFPSGQGYRYVGTEGDLSVFKLTPAHKGKTWVPEGVGSSKDRSQSSLDSRPWHAPVTGVSGEGCPQDRSSGQQRQASSEEQGSRLEDASQCRQHTQPSPAPAQAFLHQQQLQEASPVLHDLLETSLSDSQHHSGTNQGDQSVLDLPSQQQQTGPRNHVGQHSATPRQGTRNKRGKFRRKNDSDGDVIVLDVENDITFVGGDQQSSVARTNGGVNENVNSSRSGQSSVSNQEVLTQITVSEDSDESGDDFIILDLSLVPPELEEHEQETSLLSMVERGHVMGEQVHQEERGSSEQVSQCAVAAGQEWRMSTQSTDTAEPSEIQVLETVSLSEQQGTCLDGDATPKTYCQLSAESYYRCGCLKGACGFRTVLPSQLELHLQENHPYDVLYPCVHCGSREAGVSSLLSHLEQHLAPQDSPLHCFDASCQFVSFSPEELLGHIRQRHPQQASYTCWRCRAEFNSLAVFCLHVQQNLLTIVACQLCSARDVARQGILMHMASSHPDKGLLIRVEKILLCSERRANHWDAADHTAEEVTVSDREEVVTPGSAKLDSLSVTPPQLPPLDAQERDATGHETQKQMTETREKEKTVDSPSKCRQRKRWMTGGKMNKSPTVCKSKPAREKATATNNAKALYSNAITAEKNKPSGRNMHNLTAKAKPAAVKLNLPRKQHPVHLSSQGELSERSQQCAREETVFLEITGDVRDIQEEHAREETVFLEITGDVRDIQEEHAREETVFPDITGDVRDIQEERVREETVFPDITGDVRDIQEEHAREETVFPDITGDVRDIQEEHAREETVFPDITGDVGDIQEERVREETVFPDITGDVRDIQEERVREETVFPDITGDVSDIQEERVREETVFPDITGDVSDIQEEHVEGETQKEDHAECTSTPARAKDGEVDDGMISETETEEYSWIDHTYSVLETKMLGCCFCSHTCRFMENHVKHIHSSHRIHFKGFACQRCSFISIDQDAEREHRCGGSHQLRDLFRITYDEDAAAVAPSMNGHITGPSSTGRQRHLMTTRKQKLSESSSPSEESRMSSEKVDSVPCPAKQARRSETGSSSFSPKLQKAVTSERRSAPSVERRVWGVELMCNICGQTGSSRSGMQRHVYSQHAAIMACPVCSDCMANDRELQRHLSDMHPDHISTFRNMKSQNYITQRSAFSGEDDSLKGKSQGHNDELRQNDKEVSSVGPKQLANGCMQDGANTASAVTRHHQTIAETRHNHENEPCQNGPCFSNTPRKQFKTEFLACKLCGFSHHKSVVMRCHVYSEHPEKMKCSKCGLQLTSDRKLVRHLSKAHPKEKDALYRQLRSLTWIGVPDNTSWQFVCKLCGHSSTQSEEAQAHLYTDHKDRMKCPRCLVELSSDQELDWHVSNEHASDRDVLYAQHCWKSWYEVSREQRERTPISRPALSDLVVRIPLILCGEIASEVEEEEAVNSNSCAELSMTVPLMTKEEVAALASREVKENMEFRCPHCTSDFKWRHKFYEHLSFHYHHRCFRCAHCSFHAFCGSSIVNHSKRSHTKEPRIVHVPNPRFERRIERVIGECFVSVTEPHTERRLLAYERARLKKQNKKPQPTKRARLPKKTDSSPVKKKKEAVCQKEKTGDEKKMPCKKGGPKKVVLPKKGRPKKGRRPKKALSQQSGTDTDDTGELLMCPYCRGKKKSRLAVETEIRFHIHYKPYACPYCPLTSGSEWHVKTHITSTHPRENVVMNYERIEHKEGRFEVLLRRAVALSRTSEKIGLMSSVKKKYKKNKAGAGRVGGQAKPLPGKRRSYVRRRRCASSGEGDVIQSPGGKLRRKKKSDVQGGQEAVDNIQCAHCDFTSKDRNAVTVHIIENHQDLLRH